MALEPIKSQEYRALLDAKSGLIRSRFDQLGSFASQVKLEIYPSQAQHYRMRAEFRMWHEGDDLFYAMFAPGNKYQPIRINAFPQASERINDLILPLLAEIKSSLILSKKFFQIDFLSSQRGEILVSLFYHKQLGKDWLGLAEALRIELGINILAVRVSKNMCWA